MGCPNSGVPIVCGVVPRSSPSAARSVCARSASAATSSHEPGGSTVHSVRPAGATAMSQVRLSLPPPSARPQLGPTCRFFDRPLRRAKRSPQRREEAGGRSGRAWSAACGSSAAAATVEHHGTDQRWRPCVALQVRAIRNAGGCQLVLQSGAPRTPVQTSVVQRSSGVDRWCATGWLQECFKANWADHKQLHKLVQAATENANCVEGYEPGASLYPPCRGMRVAVCGHGGGRQTWSLPDTLHRPAPHSLTRCCRGCG